MVSDWKRSSLLNLPRVMTSPRLPTKQIWPPKSAPYWGYLNVPSFSWIIRTTRCLQVLCLSSMVYCSLLKARSSKGLLLSRRWQDSDLSVFTTHSLILLPLFSQASDPPPTTPRCMRYSSSPLLVKIPKSRLTAHLNSLVPRPSYMCNHLEDAMLSHSSLKGFKASSWAPSHVIAHPNT